jgi:hypothetical protein
VAVEAAFVLPVLIAGAMMFVELSHMALTIHRGSAALARAVEQFRRDAGLERPAARAEALLRARMAAAARTDLAPDSIVAVSLEPVATPDAPEHSQPSLWRVTVDIRQAFVTPLPGLLSIDSDAFRYRYQQVFMKEL